MKGLILYRGPSALDGKPIVVVATLRTTNEKTGPMIQTWIMRRDVSPTRAINTGADSSVCGNCKLRGKIVNKKNVGRACYVRVRNAPIAVWKAFKSGAYPLYNHKKHAHCFTSRTLRMGSYGDPAAVPLAVWTHLRALCAGHSGYTHAWRAADPDFASIVMASVDTEEERAEAKALGYRTFRVRPTSELSAREIDCPASEQSGHRKTCHECQACHGGTSATDVSIVAHGGMAVMASYRRLSLPTV